MTDKEPWITYSSEWRKCSFPSCSIMQSLFKSGQHRKWATAENSTPTPPTHKQSEYVTGYNVEQTRRSFRIMKQPLLFQDLFLVENVPVQLLPPLQVPHLHGSLLLLQLLLQLRHNNQKLVFAPLQGGCFSEKKELWPPGPAASPSQQGRSDPGRTFSPASASPLGSKPETLQEPTTGMNSHVPSTIGWLSASATTWSWSRTGTHPSSKRTRSVPHSSSPATFQKGQSWQRRSNPSARWVLVCSSM